MVFPRFGGKNGGVLSMRMQVILEPLFARPSSAPIGGAKKGEFRDWTRAFQKHDKCSNKLVFWFHSLPLLLVGCKMNGAIVQ